MSGRDDEEDVDSVVLVSQPSSRRFVKQLSRHHGFVVAAPITDPEAGRDWREIITQVVFLVVLATVGTGLLFGSAIAQGISEPAFVPLFADVFFGAGLTPTVVSLWSLATLTFGHAERRKQDLIRAAVAGVWLIIGIGLLKLVADGGGQPYGALIMGVLGGGFVEIVVLVGISKFFFLVEDDGKKIARLEAQLEQLRHSAAIGLAQSYFYNFVKPTCSHLRLPSENGGATPLDVEVGRNQFESATLTDSTLFVLIPRDLKRGADIKATLKSATDAKVLKSGKAVPRDGAPASHRPMFIFLLPRNDTLHAIDIPTVVSSIRDRADTAAELKLSAKNDAERRTIVSVDIEHELTAFTNCLLSLIERDERCKQLVRLVLMPALPFPATALSSLDIDAMMLKSTGGNPAGIV